MFTHPHLHPYLIQAPQQRETQPVAVLYSKGSRIECKSPGDVKTVLDEQEKMQHRRRRLALLQLENVR
ncbi:MAG: hypothetical protein JWP89_2672 [Schlesneria sp.]|nr:hypothetical protein [Schlesneria sp.]